MLSLAVRDKVDRTLDSHHVNDWYQKSPLERETHATTLFLTRNYE